MPHANRSRRKWLHETNPEDEIDVYLENAYNRLSYSGTDNVFSQYRINSEKAKRDIQTELDNEEEW